MGTHFRKLSLGLSVLALVVLVFSGAVLADNLLVPTAQAPLPSETNLLGEPALPKSSVTRFVPTATANILVYTDDPLVSPPYVEQALTALGLGYTSYQDATSFGTALTTGGPWDLVIVDHNNYYDLGNWWSEIEAYFNGGGKVIITTFDIDGSDSEATTLWSTLGLTYMSDMTTAAENVYRWDPSHPIFTNPESVPDLSFSTLAFDHGDHVAPLSGVAAVAGFTPGYSANYSAIIVRDDGRAIVNSFMLVEGEARDADADGTPDVLELWKNEIQHVIGAGPGPSGEVLLYQDDAYGNYFAQNALDALGTAYTAFTNDYAGFEAALASGTWNLVILNACNWAPPTTTEDALLAYINGGGKAILVSWQMADGHPLWAAAGVTAPAYYGAPAPDVYRWQPTHPIFTTPDAVSDFTWWNPSISYGTWGHTYTPSGGSAMAGIVPTPPARGMAQNAIAPPSATALSDTSIMIRSDNRVIVNGFLVSTTDAANGTSLWKDEITFMLGGPGPSGEVLLYQDDAYGNYFARDALDALGIAYTAFTDDFPGFEAALTSGTWDLVILDNCNLAPLPTTEDALLAYINGGGKAILGSWYMLDGHPLWATAGVTTPASYGSPAPNVYRWQPTHPIFTTPDAVSDFTWWNPDIFYGIWGYTYTPSGASAMAGTNPAPPVLSNTSIMIRDDNKVIVNGFMVSTTDASNGISLWKDEITFLIGTGPGPGCTEDDSGTLDIKGTAGGPGATMTVTVRMQGGPVGASSLGFEVVFDPSLLTYTGFTRGPAVADFDFFDAVVPGDAPNVVRVGGFDTGGGTSCGTCDLVYLEFTVNQCEQGSSYPLELQELKDDFAGLTSSGGCFQCGCTCDVNGDGEVTPQDALCAFQTYLGISPTACGPPEEICCDVTLDADCTPADALEIFKEYLGLDSVCGEPPIPTLCTAPPYNPEKWNDGGTVQYNNNCYNFANDEITGTFAQPGRYCGDMYASLTCPEVYDAAACDDLVPSDRTSACPDGMHKVYLVVAPGGDYHWYRKDTGGMWSHKPGGTIARDWDESGASIPDPEIADTGWYTAHCGYMCACGDYATIQ